MDQISTKEDHCRRIEKAIRGIRAEYKNTEKKIQASGIPHLTVDVDSLIRAECRKNKVKESVVRTVGGWKNLKTGLKMSVVLEKD